MTSLVISQQGSGRTLISMQPSPAKTSSMPRIVAVQSTAPRPPAPPPPPPRPTPLSVGIGSQYRPTIRIPHPLQQQQQGKHSYPSATRPERREKRKTTAEDLASESIPNCDHCKRVKAELICSTCEDRWYCSRSCQNDDWDRHENVCSETE
jgi:hypothetical protein